MKVGFYTKGTPPSSIRVVITHRGKTYRKAVGISVDKWDVSRQKCGVFSKDNALKAIRIELESCLDDLSTETDILAILDRIKGGKVLPYTPPLYAPEMPAFAPLFREWAARPSGAKRQNQSAAKLVIEIVGEDVKWDEIDESFYSKLIAGFRKRGMRPNYQGVVIGRLKTFLNEAHSLGYLADFRFGVWRKPSEPTFAIALSQEEVDKLWNAPLPPSLARVRDLFIVGVYTAARFSDYSRLTEDNIVDGRLSFVQEKTDTPVLIPCSPRIKTVFERNGGRAPRMSIQPFNRGIKEVCRLAGIDSIVQVPEGTLARLGKKKGEEVRKWELCSSHTARRTGASILYKSGVPVRICRYLTGHTKDDTFLKYIKIDREEAADILATSPFFGL